MRKRLTRNASFFSPQALASYGGFAFASGFCPRAASLQSLLSSFVCALAQYEAGCDAIRSPRVLESVISLLRRCSDELCSRSIPYDDSDASLAVITRIATSLWGYAARLRELALAESRSATNLGEIIAFSLDSMPLHVNAVQLLLRFSAPGRMPAALATSILGCISQMAVHAHFSGERNYCNCRSN